MQRTSNPSRGHSTSHEIDQSTIIFDEALALLAILATVQEGCDAIATIAPKSTWDEIIVSRSPQNKERASNILFAVSSYDSSYIKQERKFDAIEPLTGLIKQERKFYATEPLTSLIKQTRKFDSIEPLISLIKHEREFDAIEPLTSLAKLLEESQKCSKLEARRFSCLEEFRDIVGQAAVVKSLSTVIMKGKVAPIFLIKGPCGTGKPMAARVFAAELNCESLDYASRPCGICRSCMLNRSVTVKQIDAASIMESFTPPHARYKVFIVERCHLLTIDTWNAFLEVMKEPPRNVVFILIPTNPEQIPAMIASRCQKFPFLKKKVRENDIVSRLQLLATNEGVVLEDGVVELIAERSNSSLEDAEIVLDQICLLEKNVSLALVQELVGLPSDSKIMDLLDYALSADTVNAVRTMLEVLASNVEPMSLVRQLGALITDILVGIRYVKMQPSTGFFNRNFSRKEEQNRLRQALKILSEAEEQLLVTSDPAMWLTAALSQFAPDRSVLPSSKSSVEPTPLVSLNTGPVANTSLPMSEYPSMNELEYQTQVSEFHTQYQTRAQAHTQSKQDHSLGTQDAATLTEQKLEEAWVGEQPPQQQDSVQHAGETSKVGHAPEEYLEFQVFKDENLQEIWKRVLCEITSTKLKFFLKKHGRLVAAGVAVDGSASVVKLEFQHVRDKHKAERGWRSICTAFQKVLRTAIELRIALSEFAPEDQATMQTSKNTGITPRQLPPSRRRRPKRATNPNPDKPTKTVIAVRKIRHASQESSSLSGGELSESGPQLISTTLPNRPVPSNTKNLSSRSGLGGITPRQLPPSLRRRSKQATNPDKPIKTIIEGDQTCFARIE